MEHQGASVEGTQGMSGMKVRDEAEERERERPHRRGSSLLIRDVHTLF